MSICDSIDDFAVGAMDVEQDDTFREHLATCERCRRELLEANRLIAMISELPVLPRHLPTGQMWTFDLGQLCEFRWRWSWLWMRWEVLR